MNQTYTSKIAKNSLWSTLSFVIASLCNIGISVAVTRYLGKEIYGQYSYFLWLSGIISIVAGFGFQQTLAKYLPKYFFNEKTKAPLIFRKFIKIQIIGSIIIALLCLFGLQFFEKLISFHQPEKPLLLIMSFLTIVPVSMNTFLNSSLTAIQEFKKLAQTSMFTGALNLGLIMLLIFTDQNIIGFLWLFLVINIICSCILLIQARSLLKKTAVTPITEKLFPYGAYAYISTLSSQVVWERSEVFFLGLFTDSNQIAIYVLAYSMAILFIGIWGPLNTVLNATFAEVVLTNKQEKLEAITRHGTKYLAMFMLPLSLCASLFLGDIINLLYGKGFEQVAQLFPLLVISHIIAVIITPAGNIPTLKNEMKKIMLFNVGTAAINIALDFYLITKYQAVGAMLANVISQFFSIGITLINAKKYHLGIFNKYMVRIFLMNALLAGIFLAIAPYNLALKILIAFIAAISYIFVTLKIAFDQQDTIILKNLQEIIRNWLRNIKFQKEQ